MTNLVKIKQEITRELADKEVFNALITTTFKGLEVTQVKKAIMEGMMRGFQFKDFLEKNVYALPYGKAYSLVTSIDYARKIGMRSGVVGKSAPTYEIDSATKKIISCSITVKKKVGDYIGDFTATVDFSEYSTGRNLWTSKPKTMIAKVAEMHALRMACPEELAQSYTEEEVHKEHKIAEALPAPVESYKEKLEKVGSLVELKTVWASLPIQAKQEFKALKEELKSKFEASVPAAKEPVHANA